MLTTTVTLGQLVDRALLELQAPAEIGKRCVLGADALDTTSDTQFTLTGDAINISDLIEFGAELLLVTDKNSDVDPVYTAARGYYGTTPAVATAGTVGTVNPQWPRIRVQEAIRRAFPRMEALGLPLVLSAQFNRTADKRYVEMPASTRDVKRVGYFDTYTYQFIELGGWRYIEDLPTGTITSGKIVRLPRTVDNDSDLEITYTIPYRWSTHPSTPDEAATITVPEGAEDLPAMYAAAWLVSRREVSRSEIDKAEEWNRGEPQRGGVSSTLVRQMWTQFYQSVDECRRLNVVPISRPYIPMARY